MAQHRKSLFFFYGKVNGGRKNDKWWGDYEGAQGINIQPAEAESESTEGVVGQVWK